MRRRPLCGGFDAQNLALPETGDDFHAFFSIFKTELIPGFVP